MNQIPTHLEVIIQVPKQHVNNVINLICQGKRNLSLKRQSLKNKPKGNQKEKPILVNGKELNEMETDDLINYINGKPSGGGNSKSNNNSKGKKNKKKKNKNTSM